VTIVSNAFVAADTIVSNAFGAADTAMSNSLVATYGAADTVVSNAFVASDTVVSNAYTNTAALAAAALPKAGGTMTGVLDMGANYISNAVRVYLNTVDYIYTDGTNLLWSDN